MQFMNSNTMMIRWLSLCVLALAVSGCAGADKGGDLSERFSWLNREPKPQQPSSVVLVWTDTVLNTIGQPPVRGFGGRVMFFDHAGGDQVPVNGKLIVYAYDESDGDAVTNVPDRKFVFTSEQLKELYSETDMGHSYSVWIPWDKVGGERKQISLLARFESNNGAITISEMSRQMLPGVPPLPVDEQQVLADGRPQGAVQVSYDQSGRRAAEPLVSQPVITRGERHTRRRRMTVDTIDLDSPLRQLMIQQLAAGGQTQAETPAETSPMQSGTGQLLAPPAPPQATGAPLPAGALPPNPTPANPQPWATAGIPVSGATMPAYADQPSALPSVWEWARLRAQQDQQKTEQRRRPQAHSSRPRPSAQASRFARQAPGRDWSQPSLPGQPSAPPGGLAPARQVLGQ
jgi:hypothetical protein